MIISEIEAKYRYQDYLREVDNEQLCSRFKKTTMVNSALQYLGNALISAGQHLKGNQRPEQANSLIN